MEKTTHQTALNKIGDKTDKAFSDIASIRTLIKEINKRANLTQLSYRMFLDLLDLKLLSVSESLLDLSIDIDEANDAPTIDNEPEVTENDLPFQ